MPSQMRSSSQAGYLPEITASRSITMSGSPAAPTSAKNSAAAASSTVCPAASNMHSASTVSYTHLDVYKRQVKSIVSSLLADRIAAAHSVQMRQVLTGFKYIAGQIERSLREGKGLSLIHI